MNRARLQQYFKVDLGWGWTYQSRVVFGFLCAAAEAARGGVLLDAGAGYQRYRPFFEEALYLAQEHPDSGAKRKNIKKYDILCDVRHIPLSNACVDVVLSTVSLEHMEYPQAFVDEAYRVLRPGGTLWIQAPFVYHEHEVPYDFQRVTRYGLARHFRHAGFSHYEVSPSSSSTSAAVYALTHCVTEDARRLGNSLKVKCIRRPLMTFNRLYCRLLKHVFDRGPFEDTSMPIGWISWAKKQGKSDRMPGPLPSAEDFMKGHAVESEHVSIREGVLVWDDEPNR